MKKNNKKRNIIIPICIFLILVSLFFFFNFLIKLTEYKVFVFNNEVYYLYQESNKEWFSISQKEFFKKYGSKNHTLYVDNANKGEFYFEYFDGNLEMVNRKTDIITRYTEKKWFTYAGSAKIDYIPLQNAVITSNDEKPIFDKLKEYKLEKDYNASYTKKYILNIGNDIDDEYIYVISNMVNYDNTKVNTNLDKTFTFMFLRDGNNIYDIYSNVDGSNMCVPTVKAVLNFNSDDSYKFVTYCDNPDKNTSELNLYNFKNGKFSHINVNN